MNEIKLPAGWLQKASAEVRESCKDWPPEFWPLRNLNAGLVKTGCQEGASLGGSEMASVGVQQFEVRFNNGTVVNITADEAKELIAALEAAVNGARNRSIADIVGDSNEKEFRDWVSKKPTRWLDGLGPSMQPTLTTGTPPAQPVATVFCIQ